MQDKTLTDNRNIAGQDITGQDNDGQEMLGLDRTMTDK